MFLFFWHPIRDTVQGENRSRPVALSGKPLGERQLAIPPEIQIYTPDRDAGGTNDHVGQGLLDHSYLLRPPGTYLGSCEPASVHIICFSLDYSDEVDCSVVLIVLVEQVIFTEGLLRHVVKTWKVVCVVWQNSHIVQYIDR